MKQSERTSRWRLCFLAAWVVAAAALFFPLDWKSRFVSDVSALLPAADEEDETATLLSQVRREEERLIFGALLPPAGGWNERREEAGGALLKSLRESGPFEKVAEGAGPSDPEAVAAAVYEARMDLLLPSWAAKAGLPRDVPDAKKWATAIVASFDDFLTQPEATAMADLLPADPFPLAAYMAEAAPAFLDEEEEKDGPFLFWAVQADSPFAREGQRPVLDALERAASEAEAALPGARLRQGSVARFAVESEARIHREITALNFFSLLLVGTVAFFFLRRRLVLLHLVVIAVLSVAGGLAAVLLLFPSVHVLTLVVGGLLVGVAVDYGIHILLHRPLGRSAGLREVLREVRKPLLASALSTAAGFAALHFADLPLLRQIGIFVAGGLIAALAASWLYLPLWPRPDALASFAEPKGGARPGGRIGPVLVLLFLLPLAGWFRLEWHDDIRELQPPMPDLWKSDAEVRGMFSGGKRHASWICAGATPRDAREALAAFETQWQDSGGEREDLISLSPWVAEPAARDQIHALFKKMPDFKFTLIEEMEASGFQAEEFDPFFRELDRWLSPAAPGYGERLKGIASALDGPARLLLRGGDGAWFFLVSSPKEKTPPGWSPPPGAVSTEQIETLNELFSEYRKAAWRLSGISLVIIATGVVLAYGPAAGASALLLPCVAWAWGMGALGAIGSPLSLFHVLGGFLGFCVALDYGLFFAHARAAGRLPPGSIRVSAATTLSAFGVLSFASIPAVAALGMSVFLVVFAALCLTEAAHACLSPPSSEKTGPEARETGSG